MPELLSYHYVKNYIESVNGYKLHSNEYVNNHEKLSVQCPNGHIFEMSYNGFQQGKRCPICFRNKQRHSYEKIKENIEFAGYKLLSKNYIQARKKLSIQCPNGHIYESTYHNFFTIKSRCPICFTDKIRNSYEKVKTSIESEMGYILMSDSYQNNHEKLSVQCPNGHIFEMSYNGFQQGKRCPICWKENFFSREEKDILSYVQQIYNGTIIPNDRTQIINPKTGWNFELDIWMPDLNKAIEYNGEYWHGLNNQIKNDIEKIKQCNNMGIKLLTINESDWLKNKDFTIIDIFIYK
jgi:hypothetical protein